MKLSCLRPALALIAATLAGASLARAATTASPSAFVVTEIPGTIAWRFPESQRPAQRPYVDAAGKTFVISTDAGFEAHEIATGGVRWQVETADASIAAFAGETFYYEYGRGGADDTGIAARDASGASLWTHRSNENILDIDADAKGVVVLSYPGIIRAYDPSGRLAWAAHTSDTTFLLRVLGNVIFTSSREDCSGNGPAETPVGPELNCYVDTFDRSTGSRIGRFDAPYGVASTLLSMESTDTMAVRLDNRVVLVDLAHARPPARGETGPRLIVTPARRPLPPDDDASAWSLAFAGFTLSAGSAKAIELRRAEHPAQPLTIDGDATPPRSDGTLRQLVSRGFVLSLAGRTNQLDILDPRNSRLTRYDGLDCSNVREIADAGGLLVLKCARADRTQEIVGLR